MGDSPTNRLWNEVEDQTFGTDYLEIKVRDDGQPNKESATTAIKREAKMIARDLLSTTMRNLDAASANFLVNVEVTLSILLIMNSGFTDKEDTIKYSYAVMSIFISYLLSYLISGGQPFFKGLTLVQAYIIQNQINQYGKSCIYLTCIIMALILAILTASKCYRLNKITPSCILVGLKVAIGRPA